MIKSDYTYTLHNDLLSILDLNLGGRSVTNNIENVVEEICLTEQVDPANLKIIYADSEGIWDGWDHKTQFFIHLGTLDYDEAVNRIINYYAKN